MNKNTKKIALTILVVIFVAGGIYLAINNLFGKKTTDAKSAEVKTEGAENAAEPTPKELAEAGKKLLEISSNDIVIGNKNASVTIIEYASLSCPHCALFYSDAFPRLKADYIDSGKIKFVYRDFPLNQPALAAGILALCKVKDVNKDADKYYNFIKVLFRTQESWAFVQDFSDKLKTIAKLDGMSDGKFESCIKDKNLQERILKSRLEAAQLLQISSTPTFFINGEVISGYSSYTDMKNVIEKKLGANPSAASDNKTQNQEIKK